MRPTLSKELRSLDFMNYYWLKVELQTFCREEKMSASGSKAEITERINTYLETGTRLKPVKKRKSPSTNGQRTELTVHTVIGKNHRCSQQVRAFFKSKIPPFHFSAYIQRYFKEHPEQTYQDVIDAWVQEEQRKKDPHYKKEIGSQFEYNQFTRDFFADPANKSKTRKDAIDSWNKIKVLPGSNAYRSN
ncbi:DUF6434 domain-containing protein [Alkalicoccobacillus murimartini]|uniref:DUF6434 domain-containing protein n=1 Tax=Alkalicoccobacillus murimartini TaxID=171685 RepID=A0ABT9YCD8_9BACI|nr:DUF6434 domain-containing protein [Alkalicoccobacillus murimartini]MDQ0205391.1 hypothetical protein [Alkalicoccobacillus murimartini]